MYITVYSLPVVISCLVRNIVVYYIKYGDLAKGSWKISLKEWCQ